MKLIAFILSAILVAGAAHANVTPFIYTRTVLKIIPKPAPVKLTMQKEIKETGNKPTEILPTLTRVTKEFTVDVRSPQFLTQNDLIFLQPFTDKDGMLILIDPPEITSLKASNLLAKFDVLFVLEDGIISKIAPELSLKNMSEPIESDKPVRGFLFLKEGTAKASDIRPGDRVENPLFKTHPVVIEETPEAKPEAAPQK